VYIVYADILAWVSVGFLVWVLGVDPEPNPQKINLGLDSEFNSMHFGIEINKCLKFLGPKMCDNFETSF